MFPNDSMIPDQFPHAVENEGETHAKHNQRENDEDYNDVLGVDQSRFFLVARLIFFVPSETTIDSPVALQFSGDACCILAIKLIIEARFVSRISVSERCHDGLKAAVQCFRLRVKPDKGDIGPDEDGVGDAAAEILLSGGHVSAFFEYVHEVGVALVWSLQFEGIREYQLNLPSFIDGDVPHAIQGDAFLLSDNLLVLHVIAANNCLHAIHVFDTRLRFWWHSRIGWSWYHTPNGLETLVLDAIVTVESQPEISRLRRDLWGEILATEVTEEIGVAVLAVTYLEKIVTTVCTPLEFEFVSKIELQQHAFLSFQDFHALREVWIVFWIPRTVKFLFSVVTDSEFLACVLFCNVPHLTTYNVVYNERSRRCADIPPIFPGVE